MIPDYYLLLYLVTNSSLLTTVESGRMEVALVDPFHDDEKTYLTLIVAYLLPTDMPQLMDCCQNVCKACRIMLNGLGAVKNT